MPQIGPFGFMAGLNTASDIYTQPKDSLLLQNDWRFSSGNIISSYGMSALCTAISGVTNFDGIYPNFAGPSSIPLIMSANNHTYSLSSSGTVTDITNATGQTPGTEIPTTADTLNGIMVISDPYIGGGWATQWNGTTLTKLTAIDPSLLKTVNNFLFSASPASSTFRWSGVSDPTTWPAASSLDYRKGDGDVIRAFGAIGTDLYIFKGFSIGRLSTVSQTVSGTVTLGPLVTAITGVGAQGPQVVTNLPDGRIIFLGSDFHAYIFDGSTLTDISDQPYPESNVQSVFDSNSTGFLNLLGYSVTCYRPRHEVWFTFGLISGGQQTAMIYDYVNNVWSSANTSLSLGYGPMTYVPNLTSNASTFSSGGIHTAVGDLVSASSGFIYCQDILNSTGFLGACAWEASILLNGEGKSFLPRSLILFHKTNTVAGGPSFFVSYAFEGGALGNTKGISLSTSYTRTIIPLVLPILGQSSVGPSSIQIKITDPGGQLKGVTFAPFFLSDQVMV